MYPHKAVLSLSINCYKSTVFQIWNTGNPFKDAVGIGYCEFSLRLSEYFNDNFCSRFSRFAFEYFMQTYNVVVRKNNFSKILNRGFV